MYSLTRNIVFSLRPFHEKFSQYRVVYWGENTAERQIVIVKLSQLTTGNTGGHAAAY